MNGDLAVVLKENNLQTFPNSLQESTHHIFAFKQKLKQAKRPIIFTLKKIMLKLPLMIRSTFITPGFSFSNSLSSSVRIISD